jgi:hypothetical protein
MVSKGVVPQVVVASGVKAVPMMVNINPALSAVAEDGDRLVMAGGEGFMVKETEFDPPPPTV